MTTLKNFLRRTRLKAWIDWRRDLRGAREWRPSDRDAQVFYRRHLPPDGLCFDIGANVGHRTKVFLSLGARVIAAEPQPRCVRVLNALYGKHPRFALVAAAVGAEQGFADLHLSDASVVSSLSNEWIEAVRQSGRFEGTQWRQSVRVPVTTLDDLIARYGRPDFVKIDVEGFEREVMRGLSQPVPLVSFEFTPELTANTVECVRRLASIGVTEFALSLGETFALEPGGWRDSGAMISVLEGFAHDRRTFGDVYARMPGARGHAATDRE